MSVPDGNFVKGLVFDEKWKAKKNMLHPLEHINCFNSQTLIQLGAVSGLEAIHVEGATVYYTHKDSLMRRKLFTESKQRPRETNVNGKEELHAIKNSFSYKLGRFITFPFRYMRSKIKIKTGV